MASAVDGCVLDANIHSDHAQAGKLPGQVVGHRIGAALAHEGRRGHAVFQQDLAHSTHAPQTVLWSRQEQVLVVKAKHGATTHGVCQHRHLPTNGIGRP